MKKLRVLHLVILIMVGVQLFGQSNTSDTIFIHQDSILGSKQSIFIISKNNNKFYERISSFNLQQFDVQGYKYSINYLKENNLTLSKREIKGLPVRWVTLKYYKDKYFVYHPCDFLFHYRVSINDTTYIDWTGEGPIANKIIDYKKIDDSTFQFKLAGIYNQNRRLIVHILNKEKGIAIFEEEEVYDHKKLRYLMIDADKIKVVPIIINNCEVGKQIELRFDDPDFDNLLGY